MICSGVWKEVGEVKYLFPLEMNEGFLVEISATTIWDLLTPYQARQIH